MSFVPGIKTVAVYSEPDVHALHVRMADEAVCVGPAKSADSYLNIENILEAVHRTGAQAVHPGYGFLSENHVFQEALQADKIVFIGPGTEAITAMGDKIRSKRIAIKAGVNTVPGHVGEVDSNEEVKRIAQEIGYPVMIKASAGGGGKGMRIAWNDKEAVEGFRLSKEEAKGAFGDDRMFIEKYIVEPRHIEIQLVADKFGNVLTLPERECSIQRRNQKVIEECPSTLLNPETRKAMQDQAAALARAVGYECAGTVEFLADKHQDFFFLEMNTRLQVEHPVTEFVSGVDLVEQQLRVSAGYPLPEHLLKDLPIDGHSIEARVYAEDPFRGFLPSTGRLTQYDEPHSHEPPTTRNPLPHLTDSPVRLDAGVTVGSEISMFYDPMIAKLITHGHTREDAIRRLKVALDRFVVRGVGHNIPFLRDVCDKPRFHEGRISTNFIPEEYPEGFQGVPLLPHRRLRTVAAAAIMHATMIARNSGVAVGNPHGHPSSGLGTPWDHPVVVQFHGGTAPGEGDEDKANLEDPSQRVESHAWEVLFESIGPSDVAPNGSDFVVRVRPFEAERAMRDLSRFSADEISDDEATEWAHAQAVELRGVEWEPHDPIFSAAAASEEQDVDIDPEMLHRGNGPSSAEPIIIQHLERTPEGFALQYEGARRVVTVRPRSAQLLAKHVNPPPQIDYGKVLMSPMPGTLVSVAVEVGEEVQAGEEVAVVEAMKMQNVLRAPKHARVSKIHYTKGETLAADDIIVEFEDA